MRKYFLTAIFLALTLCKLFGQNSEVKKVKYAKTEIDVPTNYAAKDEYSIESNTFSAQWLYLTKEMVDQSIDKQIFGQFEGQLKYSKATDIEFNSSGGQFKGKKYLLKGDSKFKYRILAFGIVNGQPLILNMGFNDDPKSDKKFDDLMKKFISYKK